MRTTGKTATLLLLAIAALAPSAARASDPTPSTTDFILRVAASEVDGIAYRNNLEIISQIDTPVDPQGRSIYRVRAAEGSLPELVIDDIQSLEPAALGIEQVVLASLPELDGQSLSLSTAGVLQAFADAETVQPPSGTIDPSWMADPADREVEDETKDLEVRFEHDGQPDPTAYTLRFDFEDGSFVTWDSSAPPPSPVRIRHRLDFDGNKADWRITNGAATPITLDGLTVDWPAINGSLNRVELDGATIYDPDLPAAFATIDSGWNGDATDRQIPAGATAVLRLEFDEDVATDAGAYVLELSFAEGYATAFEPVDSSCIAVTHLEPRFSGSEVKLEVVNTGAAPITLEALDLAWPTGNGEVLTIKLGGKLIYESAESSPVAIDSGWVGLSADREIKAGKTEELKLAFEMTPGTEPASYAFTLEFAEGYQAVFDPNDQVCPVDLVHRPVTFHNEKVEWALTARSSSARRVAGVTLGWPETNGVLTSMKLKGKELQREVVREFGEHPDGSPRFVWTAYVDQPASALLAVDAAQSTFMGNATVAIIDTGIDPNHPLLADHIVPGYDFVNEVAGSAAETLDVDQSAMIILDQSAMIILDDHDLVPLNQSAMIILDDDQIAQLDPSTLPPAFGHGTMVAGVIHRVAPEASLMPLKAFTADGHGDLYDIVRAIYYAVDNGANVVNMSFSMETFSPELMRAINHAARNGVACISSAGNEGKEQIVFPAAFGNTLGVAATNETGQLSDFSNWGSDLVTVAAPGESILTTYPGGGWALASGTSFATPWISGAVALFADKIGTKHAPGKADYYLASNALADADPITGEGEGKSGHGRAQLERAIDRVKSGHYAADRPLGEYTVAATFAEGCTAHYPPPGAGGGCAAEGAGQLVFNDKKVFWSITNEGDTDVTLDAITIDWPTENGELKKIESDGERIHDVDYPAASASISSGWLGAVADRMLAPGQTRVVLFEFEHDVVWTY